MVELIHEIVSKAQTLDERIANRSAGGDGIGLDKQGTIRLREWKSACALNEEEIFRRRLACDNISEVDIPFILMKSSPAADIPLPPWAIRLKAILPMLGQPGDSTRDWQSEFENWVANEDCSGIPFVHLLYPFIIYAESCLNVGFNNGIFSDRIKPALRNQLFSSLSSLTVQTFYLEFTIFRVSRQGQFGKLLSLAEKESHDELYHEFVQHFYQKGWTGFLLEYAVLAKLIAVTLDHWIRNTDELLQAIINDFAGLVNHFSFSQEPGKVVKIISGISDSHWKGKKVHIITFESGLKIVYKPRSLELEYEFSALLSQINNTAFFPELVTLDILPRNGYGWVRFVDYRDCSSLEQIREYYRRTGMLICIVYILKGNDCHYENIIAHGEYPVLIDLETIMHPSASGIDEFASNNATFLAGERVGLSVYKTGLLPQWVTGKDDYTMDVSGTGGGGNAETPYMYLEWNEVNTDRMNATLKNFVSGENANIPCIEGKRYLPSEFEPEIIDGFSRLYRYFRDNKKHVRFDSLADKEVRFIFRNTRVYALIHKKLRDPRYMRSGIDRSIQMEGLSRAFLRKGEKNENWVIFRSEIRQMENLDIPIFTAGSSGTDLCSGEETVVPNFFDAPVFRQVIQRLDLLTEDDLNIQIRFIRASLFFKVYEEGKTSTSREEFGPLIGGLNTPSHYRLIWYALKIGDHLAEEAIKSVDGSISWISVATHIAAGRLQMRPVSPGLYDGLSGLALFLSALYRVTGQEKYRNLVSGALQSIRKTVEIAEEYPLYVRLFPIGAISGLTSIIYSLVLISEYLGDQGPVLTAERLASMITPEYIGEDKAYDVISGSSGAILGLIRLFNKTGHQTWLEKADICAGHLIRNKVVVDDGKCGWPSAGGRLLSGFSHGVAGISYSLLRLYELNKKPELIDTAIDAIRYENTLYRSESNNWLDIRDSVNKSNAGSSRFMTSWCHGAPGIALGRLASLHILDNAQMRHDIDSALEKTYNTPHGIVEHLCCGNLGRAEILFYASGKKNDPGLKNHALEIAARTIQKREKMGYFALYNQTFEKVNNLGFFQGLSGIGYQFLRFAEPEIIRPILAIE